MADANADQKTDVTNVADGDRVLVQAGVPKRTTYAEGAEAIAAHKLVDKTTRPSKTTSGADAATR